MKKIRFIVPKILIIIFLLFMNISNGAFAIDMTPVNLALPTYPKRANDFTKKVINPSKSSGDVNFVPYMMELQRSIKHNWNPPKEASSKHVVMLFKIDKSGELKAIKIFKSSGSRKVDDSAILAVEKTAPFKALPEKFSGSSIDIQFTFDYNVFDYAEAGKYQNSSKEPIKDYTGSSIYSEKPVQLKTYGF